MIYSPFHIGKSFRIIPPGIEPAIERIDLIMRRGAFGSGEHETTESCLVLMETLPEITGARVLDLGSGTGILAIAALKLGAAHAVCVDIETDAVETARSNCDLNSFKDCVTHVTGTLNAVEGDLFDLVLANIYGDILLDLATQLSTKVRSGGTLLLSGILWEYNFDVRHAYEEEGFEIITNRMLEEFSTVLLRKV